MNEAEEVRGPRGCQPFYLVSVTLGHTEHLFPLRGAAGSRAPQPSLLTGRCQRHSLSCEQLLMETVSWKLPLAAAHQAGLAITSPGAEPLSGLPKGIWI